MPNKWKVCFDLIDNYEEIKQEAMTPGEILDEVDQNLVFSAGLTYENLVVKKDD